MKFSASHAQGRTCPLKLLSCSSIFICFRSGQNEDRKLKTKWASSQNIPRSEEDQIIEKSPKEEWKGQSLKSLLDEKGHLHRDLDGAEWRCCLCLQYGYRSTERENLLSYTQVVWMSKREKNSSMREKNSSVTLKWCGWVKSKKKKKPKKGFKSEDHNLS